MRLICLYIWYFQDKRRSINRLKNSFPLNSIAEWKLGGCKLISSITGGARLGSQNLQKANIQLYSVEREASSITQRGTNPASSGQF
jgi:hypothetical protein